MRRSGFWTLATFIVLLDQWTKHLVECYLPARDKIVLIPGVLELTHVRNPGTAFGLFGGGGGYLSIVAIAAAVFIVSYWRYLKRQPRPPSIWLLCGLAMPLGGAIGNLIDRLRYGQVTDFIYLHLWPVFNVADSAITIGAVLVAFHFFFIQDRRTVAAPAGESVAEAACCPVRAQTEQ